MNINEEEAEERILELLREATRLRLISDVPLGVFLSGGMDSSGVVAMMSQLSSIPVKTFSIGFSEKDYDELKFAKIIAKRFSTDHHEFIVKPEMVEILPKLVWHYNEPFADSSALPSYYLSRETKNFVKVALCGDGGDENFGGYPRYLQAKIGERLSLISQKFPFPFKKFLEKVSSLKSLPESFLSIQRLRWFVKVIDQNPSFRYSRFLSIFPEEERKNLYAPYLREMIKKNYIQKFIEDKWSKVEAKDFLEKMLGCDFSLYLPDCLLVKMDIASMANSLEVRSPYLDDKLIEFVARLPSSFKLKGRKSKYILKKSLSSLLPAEILYRRKMGFGVPLSSWFRGELKNYLKEVILGERAKRRDYFDMDYVEKLFNEHISGKVNHSNRLWALLMFELWHQIFIDK